MTQPDRAGARASVWIGALLVSGCAIAPVHEAPSRGLAAPLREVLSNGMRLIIQEHWAADVVALQLWVGVGARDEAPDERGFSHLVEHMLFKGTETRGRGFMDEEVEGAGGRANAGTSYDYTYYHMLLPATRAARGIELLADMAFHASFDPEEIDREREVVFEEARLEADNLRTFLPRRLYELAFDGHAYGFPVLGDPAALRDATRATLRGYYTRHYVVENMALVVVGPVNPGEVRAAAARAFGSVPGGAYVRPLPPLAPNGGHRLVVERPERQASLGLGWAAPELGHPDMFALDLLAQILGGSRSSRLYQALRERARLVSSIRAGYATLQRAGLVTVTAQFERGDEGRVEAAILDELQRVREDGVTAEELRRAVTASESEREFSRETVEGLARAWGRAETLWSLEAERRYQDGIRTVTRDQIREAARRYLGSGYARLALHPKGEAR
jgi:zinc protease